MPDDTPPDPIPAPESAPELSLEEMAGLQLPNFFTIDTNGRGDIFVSAVGAGFLMSAAELQGVANVKQAIVDRYLREKR